VRQKMESATSATGATAGQGNTSVDPQGKKWMITLNNPTVEETATITEYFESKCTSYAIGDEN